MPNLTDEIPSIPRETTRAARAVFRRRNFYIKVGERLGVILEGIQLESLSMAVETSRAGGAILPLTTFFQFVERLSDEQAVDAMRTRNDWKYALHLPIDTLAIHQNALCEFRQKVISDAASQHEFQILIDRLIVLNPPCRDRLLNCEVLALLSAVCTVNLTKMIQETMLSALGALAGRFPRWLLHIACPHWYGRFYYLRSASNTTASRRQRGLSIEELSEDIQHLLEEVRRSNSPKINEIPEIKALRHIWEQQYKTWSPALHRQDGTSIIWIGCDSCINRAG